MTSVRAANTISGEVKCAFFGVCLWHVVLGTGVWLLFAMAGASVIAKVSVLLDFTFVLIIWTCLCPYFACEFICLFVFHLFCATDLPVCWRLTSKQPNQ